jgi:ABC-type amino acid transport system permease subunit
MSVSLRNRTFVVPKLTRAMIAEVTRASFKAIAPGALRAARTECEPD